MENDINQVLATKRAWRNAENIKKNRRKKDGTIEQRKDYADVLRSGREIQRRKNWFMKIIRKISSGFLILTIFMYCHSSYAYTTQEAILSVIGEAEGESQESKEGIACAIHYRGYLQGIYGLHSYRVRHHLYSKKTYENAVLAVEMVDDQESCEYLVNGAQYWASLILDQKWIHKMELSGYTPTATIGNTIFFRKD